MEIKICVDKYLTYREKLTFEIHVSEVLKKSTKKYFTS